MQLDIKLEEECPVCYGDRSRYFDNDKFKFVDGTCPECKGEGQVPTEFGRELLDFVKRHNG